MHLTVPATVRLSNHPGLVVHHVCGFSLDAPQTLTRHGVPVTRLDRALVDSWPLLPAGERRGPVIQTVAGRHSTPERIAAALTGCRSCPAGRSCGTCWASWRPAATARWRSGGHDHFRWCTSRRRLVHDTAEVRREILAVLAARR
ncbi:hypothetical protein ACN27J_05510 [Solwaraspora sp. WMMB762]|uniref:hypothetical protein n=1 Tax=Solwaraspora sp. WMMB762 TaxID=3404120 RepID=UPI003B957B23